MYSQFKNRQGEWTIKLSSYRDDIEAITGVALSDNPTQHDLYRARTFLEGFIEEQRAIGRWTSECLTEYPSFSSTAEVEALTAYLHERTPDR